MRIEKYAPYIKGVFSGLLVGSLVWLIASLEGVSNDTKIICTAILFAVVAIRDKLEELKRDL